MSWIRRIFGITKKDFKVAPALGPEKNICSRCGNSDFSYDSYWKEFSCQKCGWIIPGEMEKQKQQPQSTMSTNETQKVHEGEIELKFRNPPSDAGHWYYLSEVSNKIYDVDLENIQCNCPNFLKGREVFDANDARRYCKHLFSLSREIGFCNQLNNNHELILNYLRNIEENVFSLGGAFYLITIDNSDIFIVQNMYSMWFDVYTRKRRTIDSEKCTGDIERYGYNIERNRWSYGYAPYQPMKIKSYIRSLPKLDMLQKDIQETGVELSINAFLMLPGNHLLTEPLTLGIYRELCDATEVNLIKKTLLKFGEVKNIDKVKLASNWLKHGKNLCDKLPLEAVYFFQTALSLNPKCGAIKLINSLDGADKQKLQINIKIESINESEYNKLKKLSMDNKEIIPLVSEKMKFDGLVNVKEKDEALEVINMNIPEWYDKSKNHTYVGYSYVEFIRNLLNRKSIDKRSDESNKVIDYMSSLSILNGTISSNTLAEMYKIKGVIGIKFNNEDLALRYFRQALAYNDKVGVKKYISKLTNIKGNDCRTSKST